MDDLISRQAAIEALMAEGRNVDSRYLESERIIHESDAVEAISMLPSAVKHGKWEWQDSPVFGNPYGSYICALCQNTMPHKTNYCPNCGAKMDGQDNVPKYFEEEEK